MSNKIFNLNKSRKSNQLICKFFFIFFIQFISIKSFCQTTGDEIIGIWLSQEKDAKIEIYKSGNTYAGKIIWLKEPNDHETGKPQIDKKNPDIKLRTRPIMGMNLVYGFSFNKKDKEWSGGIIYDGRSGQTYKCYLELKETTVLKIRGYIGASWMGLGKTVLWSRIK